MRYEQRHREQGLLLDQVRRGRRPSASARYCTSDQKRGPARKLITQLVAVLGDLGRPARLLNCMGLRAAESRARLKKARLSRDEAASSGRRTFDTWLPIHDWTETHVRQRVRTSGVPYHPAYDQGMTRHVDRTTARHALPSKNNEERLLLVTPELASVLAAVIHRIRDADGRVPLVARYDPSRVGDRLCEGVFDLGGGLERAVPVDDFGFEHLR
ncbi:phosphoadenosine phosphosulfate reductase family protein [Saccharomonospora sp. NPDC046836]|uniref:phosphoadenosine phosphosulfate reductase domain-containing protein n=1 Tax=Saccharomonospora sp. NPDC046836 TaxID=3156921 RepID=UPI0033FC1364